MSPIIHGLEDGRHFFAAAQEQRVALNRLAILVVRQVGVAEILPLRPKASAGEDDSFIFTGVATKNGQLLWVKKVEHGIYHRRIDLGTVAPG